MEEQKKDFRYIVRIADTDIDGKKTAFVGLTKIKGIGMSFSNMVIKKAGIAMNKKLGDTTEEESKKLSDVIADMQKTAPKWMVNRPNDPEDGEDKHLLTSDLKFRNENDIRSMRKIKSYRGVRHSAGLPVRGQRTKSNFRRNKGKGLGVSKKSAPKPSGDKK